jgi:hypothetical protein
MKKKAVKKKSSKKAVKKAVKKPVRKKKKKVAASQSADLHARAYDLFKDVHGSNGDIVNIVNTIVQDSVDQLWSQVRMKVINYGGPL